MTVVQWVALAAFVAPMFGCGWAWIQWQREEARRIRQVGDDPHLSIEPDVVREDPVPGWEQPPGPSLEGRPPPDRSWVLPDGRRVCSDCGRVIAERPGRIPPYLAVMTRIGGGGEA